MLTASILAAAATLLTGAPPEQGWVAHVSSTAELAPAGMPGARVRMLMQTQQAYMGHLQLRGLAKIPEHVHEKSAEFLYILMGDADVTMGGQTYTVKAGDALYIPPNVKHSVAVGSMALQAIQFYTPPGPEERFKVPAVDPKVEAEEKQRKEAQEKRDAAEKAKAAGKGGKSGKP